MDRYNDMMIHHFMEEEANAAVYEHEHLTILICLLQFQTSELHNVAPISHGGSKIGIRKAKERHKTWGS
jgi:hypothetical protein